MAIYTVDRIIEGIAILLLRENETEQAKKKADALLQKILAKNKSNL